MNKSIKKAFLIISIALPFLIYCVYYYSMMIKNAPYKFSEFQSIKFEYGTSDSLVNKWDSRTGEYQYLNNHDSLVKKHIHIRNDDLLFLHRKAAELGFWNFPDREVNDSLKLKGIKSTHYIMQFNYKRKSKTVVFDEGYDGDPKLKDANEQMIKIIEKVLADEENREISLK
jgi:hypothetical protein